MNTETLNNLKEDLKDADFVIAGVGEKFGYDWKLIGSDVRYTELYREINEDESMGWLLPFVQKASMDNNPDIPLKNAYSALAELLDGKNYYVVTTTIDDYVYGCGLDEKRIVTPCGGFKKLQCEKACCNDLTNMPFALLQYVQKLYNNEMSLDKMRDKYPECPFCGANLVFNQIGIDNYLEEGYLPSWTGYRMWLEKTMNRNIVMIELGADLGFMSVFRSPFEKMAAYNLKSKLYRIHPTLYMGTPEIKDRCISIKADPKEWLQSSN